MSFRVFLGALYHDWPRLAGALAAPDRWMFMRNRADTISIAPDGGGVRCDWVHTRPLHLCNIFPTTSKWLLRRALESQPIRTINCPEHVSEQRICQNDQPVIEQSPTVSFLIGHRGIERVPLLLTTLSSIAAQAEVSFECIVVEQDDRPLVQDQLPGWVRYLHAPLSEPGRLYNRSQAFNDAAIKARGEVLILHDNDMLVPMGYAARAAALCRDGYGVAQMKRFIFYLTQMSSKTLCGGGSRLADSESEQVIENLCGGGSLVISKSAYWGIGGMDESFVGWGGEDEEFWDRCRTRTVWDYGSLPLIHLWHAPQEGKRAVNGQGAHTVELTAHRRALPVDVRIAELTQRRKEKRNE
jgi:hypothetical protein